MSMTKKDFEAIAKAIKKQTDTVSSWTGGEGTIDRQDMAMDILRRTAGDMCDHFRTSNPNFDRGRFMTACGF